MTYDAIEKIKIAEKEADNIRARAAEEAKRLISDAKARGEASLEQTRAETEAEIETMFASIRVKADKLIEKSRSEAESECDELKKSARMKMRAAANEIMRGINKSCQ